MAAAAASASTNTTMNSSAAPGAATSLAAMNGSMGIAAPSAAAGADNVVPVTSFTAAPVSSTAPPAASNAEAAATVSMATASTQNDEALARSLAEAESAAVTTADDNLPLAKRRRTARRGASATDGNEPVFYGGHTSMTRDQLLDTMVRLLEPKSSGGGIASAPAHTLSLMDIKRLVFPESYETSRGGMVEMKKARSALGALVYKMGRIGRLIVDVRGSDEAAWEMLNNGESLIKFAGNEDVAAVETAMPDDKTVKEEPRQTISSTSTGEDQVKVEGNSAASTAADSAPVDGLADGDAVPSPATVVATPSSSDTPTAASTAAPPVVAMDPHLKTQLSSLEQYIAQLHRTELSLRSSLMKVIDKSSKGDGNAETLMQISTLSIATAADEVEGAAESEDWKYFVAKKKPADNGNDEGSAGEEVQWSNSSTSHPLIGKVLYRPQFAPLRPSPEGENGLEAAASHVTNSKCNWYRVVGYTPSIKAVDDATSNVEAGTVATASVENLIVERRMRFRAVPVAESDIDATPMDVDDEEDDDIEYMILTEGQVHAGIEAGMLHRRKVSRAGSAPPSSRASRPSPHPFKNNFGMRVMLTPHLDQGQDENGFQVLYGIITGYDVAQEGGNNPDAATKNKLMVLLETNEDDIEQLSVAFWATVVEKEDGATFLTDIVPSDAASATLPALCARYTIDMHEFYQGSEAFNVCASIVAYLKNHSKSGPFSVPVDPIALGIPDYHTVITNPMDISTLEKNLEEGRYSRVSTSTSNEHDGNEEDVGSDSPVYRMAYGPFYDDMMLIFDNCIKYNGETSWIGNEAAVLKKNAMKKVQQVVSKAVWQGQNAQGASSAKATGSGRTKKRSVYAEEDSDVDFEYESDYDDDFGGRKGRSSRKARGGGGGKKKASKTDIAADTIEQPFPVPENPNEFGFGGAFPHIKIQTNVSGFAFSQDWSCRYLKKDTTGGSGDDGDEAGDEPNKEETEEDEIVMLMQLQQQQDAEDTGVRRSTRARHAPQNYADEEDWGEAPASAATSAPQAPVTLPGVEYYLTNNEVFQHQPNDAGELKNDGPDDKPVIPTVCRSRLGIEGVQETIHEQFYAKLYRDHSPNALILDSGIGKYAGGSFPPYLGRVVSSSVPTSTNKDDDDAIVWEIREQYLIPALRWVLRGLVRSGHLGEVDGTLSEGVLDDAPARTSFGAGVVVPSHEYYHRNAALLQRPFDMLDEKEILRKRRAQAAAGGDDESSEEEVELSEYEKMRAERVKRNAERLRALGLA